MRRAHDLPRPNDVERVRRVERAIASRRIADVDAQPRPALRLVPRRLLRRPVGRYCVVRCTKVSVWNQRPAYRSCMRTSTALPSAGSLLSPIEVVAHDASTVKSERVIRERMRRIEEGSRAAGKARWRSGIESEVKGKSRKRTVQAQTAATQRPAFPPRILTGNSVSSPTHIPSSPHSLIPAIMRKLTSSLLVALLALAPSLSHAQIPAAHPDFSGTWVLDTAASDKGQMIPSKMTMKIAQTPKEHHRRSAADESDGRRPTTSMKYATDGSPSKNQMTIQGNPVDVSTVVTWEGATPVFTSQMNSATTTRSPSRNGR